MEKIKKSHSFSKSLIRMPSKIGSALFVLFLIVIVGLFLSKNILPASAAACVPPATIYGTDTMSVSAPTTGTYNVWIRMLAPTATSNSIMLQVDSSSCFNAGGSTSIPTNSWTWVNYQNGSSSQVMQIALTSGSHSLQLIGTTQGVEIDNILLLSDPNCVPTGNGSNCTTNQPAPTAPTNVTATANSPTSVTLNWAASTDAGGPGLGGYYVFRGGTKIATVSSSTTSYIDNSVVGATSYSYTIQAFDSSATPSVSPASTAANITTPAAKPSTPTGVTANAVGATSVSLSWTASTDVGGPGLAGYYILRGGTKIATVGVTTSYTDNTAAAN
ncbi:MAG TPA: hypothetical protein VLF79_04630, partial [Candidatus Saccharimonadales bacterium]|nr:hypothetical protein [Candidatus Saccharimonadales bacterium]